MCDNYQWLQSAKRLRKVQNAPITGRRKKKAASFLVEKTAAWEANVRQIATVEVAARKAGADYAKHSLRVAPGQRKMVDPSDGMVAECLTFS